MSRTALYRHFSADGSLLYVGITDSLSDRDKTHAAKSAWHDKVDRSEVQWCLSREHALALEKVAIQFEGPLHNKMHAPVQLPAGKLGVQHVLAKWPSIPDLARDIGMPYIAVYRWNQRGKIPLEYHRRILESAARFHIELSMPELLDANAPRKKPDPQYPLGEACEGGLR